MKTRDVHGYHGITFRDDGTGWVIQVRLDGAYHVIRAFADSAEEAARRHDVALEKLDAFTDDNARPNFPDDFSSINLSRDADGRESYKKFWEALQYKFTELATRMEELGLDVSRMRIQRAERAKETSRRRAQKREQDKTSFRLGIMKLDQKIAPLQLRPESTRRLARAVQHLREVFDEEIRTPNETLS